MKKFIQLIAGLLLLFVNVFATEGGKQYLAPAAGFSASKVSGCTPLVVNFTSTSTSDAGDPITQYEWTFGDGSTASGATASHTYTTEGKFTVSLKITTQAGLTSTKSMPNYIETNTAGPINFGGMDTVKICGTFPGTGIKIDLGDGYDFTWSDGYNGSTRFITNFGTYWGEVKKGVCTLRDTVTFFKPANFAEAHYTATEISNCGGKVTFRLNSNSIIHCMPANIEYYVEAPDAMVSGFSGPNPNPEVTFDREGDFVVTVYMDDGSEEWATYDEVTVHVAFANGANPTAPNFGGDKTICAGSSVQLDAGFEPNVTYAWSPATGLSNASIYNPIASPTTTQQYTVTKTKCGTSVTGTVNVIVGPPLHVDLGPDYKICSGSVNKLDAGVAGATYAWGSTVMPSYFATITTKTVTITLPGTYWVTVTKDGCVGRDTIVIGLKPNIVADFSYTQSGSGCGPFVVNLLDKSVLCSGTVENREWNFGDGSPVLSGINDAPSHTYAAAGTYTIRLIASTLTSKDTVEHVVTFAGGTITVNLGPDQTICAGGSTTLDAGNPGATYLWSTGETTQTISVNTAGTYSVIVSNGSCSANASKTVTVGSLSVNLGPDQTICSGGSITLDAGNPGATYLWSTGQTSQTITINSSGTYNVTVSNGSCSVSGSKTVTFGMPLAVNLGGDTTICSGNSIVLDAGNPGATYEWSNGATTRTISVNSAGTYTVTVKSGSCSVQASKVVNIGAPLVVDLGPDRELCGAFLTLDAGVSGATYKWGGTFNPSYLNSVKVQTLKVTAAGTYWVTVSKGGCVASDTVVITQRKPITAAFTFVQSGSACGPFKLSVAENAQRCVGDVDHHDWDFGDGSPIISGYYETLDHNYTNAGSYKVTLIVTSTSGYKDTVSHTINFASNLFTVDLGKDTSICANSSITLDAGNPGMSYIWSTGATSRTISVNESGTYRVTVSNGVCSVEDEIKVTVTPSLIVDLGKDTSICKGSTITLDAGNTGASYLWSNGQTGQTITVGPGEYTVAVNNGHCTGNGKIVIGEMSGLTVKLGNDTAICEGSSLILNAGHPGATYLWNTGAATQTIAATVANTYTVDVSLNGCTGRGEIKVKVIDAPTAVNLGNDTTICFGNGLQLDAGYFENASYLWSNGATTQTINVVNSGNYSVAVTGCNITVGDAINVIIKAAPLPGITQNGQELVASVADTYQWYKDGILIPGATGQKFKAKGYGTYSVTVGVGSTGCSGEARYFFLPQGGYYLGDIRVKATPNPGNGLMKLVLSKLPSKTIRATIYDRVGKKILVTTYMNLVNDLNLSGYAKGEYFVELVLDDKRVIIPVITQ